MVDSIVYPGKSKSEKKVETIAVEPKVKSEKVAAKKVGTTAKKTSTAKPKAAVAKKSDVKKAK
jgi:hypothetical protein